MRSRVRVPELLTVVVVCVMIALAVLVSLGRSGALGATGATIVPLGDDWTWSDATTVATMYLGSDVYGMGVPCSVALPLNPKTDGAVRILNVDGRPTDQVFEVKGEWMYCDAVHRTAYPYCCDNGWCEGFVPDGKTTTAMTGALIIPPGSVDPPNPTDKAQTVHVVLKGYLPY
jgi:hypothetical protein